jgi:ribonuclease P protein component
VNGKFSLPHFHVLIKKQPSPDLTKDFVLRIIITRKMRRAVDRNRVKRVLREFFRSKRALLPGRLVICKADPSAAKIKNVQLFQELSQII